MNKTLDPGHRAQGTGLRAQGTGLRAQSKCDSILKKYELVIIS